MEFKFPVNEIFKEPFVEINSSLIPPGFSGDRRAMWNTVGRVSEIVNAMGEASAAAQGLTKPITTGDRLRNSEHKIYLLIDQNASHGRGAVVGMLKIGKKGLYVFDRNGQNFQVSPSCVLDFYVHESRQRAGLGKQLFEHMLQKESVEPVKMAIDRPSEKFLAFLKKHYGLNDPIKQMNNYVVFEHFFPKSNSPSEKNDTPIENNNSGSALGKKQSANGLQSASHGTPMGRYGARRPHCSMGQIIHNRSSIQNTPEPPTGTQSAPDMHYQSGGGNILGQPPVKPAVVQSAPNIYYSSPTGQPLPQTYQPETVDSVAQQQYQNDQNPQQHQNKSVAYQQPQQQSNTNVAYQQQQPQQFPQYQQQHQQSPMFQSSPENPLNNTQPQQVMAANSVQYVQNSAGYQQNQNVDAAQQMALQQSQAWQQQQPVEPLIPAVNQSPYGANPPQNILDPQQQSQAWQQQQPIEPLIPSINQSPYASANPPQNIVESQPVMIQPSQVDPSTTQNDQNVAQMPNTSQIPNVQNGQNQPVVVQSMQNMPQSQSVVGIQKSNQMVHNNNANQIRQSQHNFPSDHQAYQAQNQQLMQQQNSVYNQRQPGDVGMTGSVVGMQQPQQPHNVAPNVAYSQQNINQSPQSFQMGEAAPVTAAPGSSKYAPVNPQANFVYGESPKASEKGDMKPGATNDEEYLRYGYPPQVQNSTTFLPTPRSAVLSLRGK